MGAVGFIDAIRDLLSHRAVSLGAGIAVEHCRILRSHQSQNGIFHHLRSGDVGIPETEIINIFPSDLGGTLLSEFKNFTDRGTSAAQIHHLF